ncbi:MAG: hypothetical protein Q6352_014220 [Candidatus Freyrarchaeum guaymaensis]|nr:hypothetical protein [Candidatus Sigynarchaeota archaeon]
MARRIKIDIDTVLDSYDLVGLDTSEYVDTPIKNILIISSDGLCLVAMSRECYDTTLFAGLLRAVAHMGREIMDSKVESISFKNQKLYYIWKSEFFFVAHVSEMLPEPVVYRFLTKLANVFLEIFEAVLPNWSENINIFRDFEEELKNYFNKNRLKSFVKEFLQQYQAKDIFLLDIKKCKVLLSTQLTKGLKSYSKMVRRFYESLNRSGRSPYGGTETIFLKNKRDSLVNIIKENKCLTIVFDQKNFFDLPSLTALTEEMLELLLVVEKSMGVKKCR